MNHWLSHDELADQAREFDSFLNEQYAVAYAMLEDERKHNEELRTELIDKVDQFLGEKSAEFHAALAKYNFDDIQAIRDKAAAMIRTA